MLFGGNGGRIFTLEFLSALLLTSSNLKNKTGLTRTSDGLWVGESVSLLPERFRSIRQ